MMKIPQPYLHTLAVGFCLLAASASLNAVPSWPTESERLLAYQERCEEVLDFIVNSTDPEDLERGGLYDIAVNLSAGTNLDWARARLRAINNPPTGNMFWMLPMVFVMYADNDQLNADDWDFIRELWRTYFPYRGDTENHWLMYYASIYLACQMFPDSGPEAWFNGKSAAENMAEAEDYIRDWINVTTAYGQGEYDSPNYIGEYIRPLALLYEWAKDDELRQLSKMMLDYVIVDFAVENLGGLYGGAHSRLYPRHILQPALAAATSHAWLLFGQGSFENNAGNMILALSDYVPPAIIQRVALDRSEPYVHRELKRTRWRIRNAGPDAFEVGGRMTTPVYKYTYMHPDFVLGSSQGGLLQPIQQQTWSLIWNEDDPTGKSNTMFGIQPYSNPYEGTMYFGVDWDTVTDLIARSKVDYDSPDKLEGGSPYEQIFQHRATLIALYDIPEHSRFPHISTLFTRDLEDRIEDSSGWIFAKGGPVYIAYRPFQPGQWKPVDWTGLLKGGAGGWFSTNFEELSRGSEMYVSEYLKNGYILEVAPVSEFDSYQNFQDAIRALPLQIRTEPVPAATFTSLDGTRLQAAYGDLPSVDGETINYAEWPLFEGPFTRADPESHELEIRHGSLTLHLDFKAGSEVAVADTPDQLGSSQLFAAMAMTGDQQASSTPTDSGLMLLDPKSHTWERLGPQIMFINSAITDPNNPDRLFFACGNGIARSTDRGVTWRLVSGWRESDVMRVVIDPEASDRVYAATIWGVTVSRDGGDTWEAANDGLPEYNSKDIVLDQRNPRRLLLATTTGLFESTDRAHRWRRVDSFPEVAVLRIERSTANPDLWMAGTEGDGVWISADDGRTWKPTAPALASANVYGVALDPNNPSLMAAGGWGTGVHVSDDGGTTWRRAQGVLPSPNITAMIFDHNTDGRLWVSTFEKGTMYSDDSGSTWSEPTLVGAYVFDLDYL